MKIKLKKEQFTLHLSWKIREYKDQIKKFTRADDNLNRVFLTEIDSETASVFKASPLFHTSTAHGKQYFFRTQKMIPVVDAVNALYTGIISEFELTDGEQIRVYLELFGEEK